jgi:uncharacterized protein
MTSSPEFSFPASNLDAAGKHFQLPLRAAWLRGALEGTAIGPSGPDGELDVRLSKSGTDVVVRGTLEAELVVPCSRCLAPAVIPVREELSVLAVPRAGATPAPTRGKRDRGGEAGKHGHADGEAEEEEIEEDSGEADIISYDGETVVLDELVRDELLLGIPMIPLCSEACPGIRPERPTSDGAPGASASADENIDPRLRPLLRLRDKT